MLANLLLDAVILVFAAGGGLYLLDIVDHFINDFGVAMAGLVEVILIGPLREAQK